MKRIFIAIISVMMLFSLASCSNQGKEAVGKVVMTYVKTPLNVPSIVEKEKGSFETAYGEMGLEFEYSELTSGPEQAAALASGDIQILGAVGNTSVILSASNGADIKIISMYSTSPKAFCIYSKDDSILSPKDLEGKTVAGPKGTVLHELLAAFLKSGGMTTDDINFVSMSISEACTALEGGSVDCALVTGAVADKCKKAGYNLVTDGEGYVSGTILTATTQKFYDSNKEIIEKFLSVRNDTLEYIKENYDEVMKITAEEIETDPDSVKHMYTLYDFRTDIRDEDIASLQKTADFMYDAGLIEKPIDINSLLLQK